MGLFSRRHPEKLIPITHEEIGDGKVIFYGFDRYDGLHDAKFLAIPKCSKNDKALKNVELSDKRRSYYNGDTWQLRKSNCIIQHNNESLLQKLKEEVDCYD